MAAQRLITPGSGNVFADLGFPEPEIALERARRVSDLSDTIVAKGLDDPSAAALLEVTVEKLRSMLVGNFHHHSIERLDALLLRAQGAPDPVNTEQRMPVPA